MGIFAFPPDPGASETKKVQPWWEIVIRLLPNDLSIELADEHKHPTIGNRKPDIIGWERGKPHSSFYIVIIGELKERRGTKEEFEASEMGQLESFMQDLLENFQPHRNEITAFLSDGKLIQFFQLQHIQHNWTFSQTPVYHLENRGGKLLMGLLKTRPSSLGMVTNLKVSSNLVTIEKVLGLGGSSIVYEGSCQNLKVVVKHFRPNCEQRLAKEVEILNQTKNVAELNGRVTELIATTDDNNALLLRPIGVPFVTSLLDRKNKQFATSQHFAELIEILRITHEKLHLVHRDITLRNFFLNDGKVFLNDWGCAVQIDVFTQFNGSLALAPRSVLTGIASNGVNFMYKPQPEDDLEMVVKCFFERIFHSLPQMTNDVMKDAANLVQFWDTELSPQYWLNLINVFAQKRDYEALKTGICFLLR